MAASTVGTIAITDCSGGLSDWFPPRLEDNQLVEAWNVEFWDGSVAGRRQGCVVRVPATNHSRSAPNGMAVHTPTTSASDNRLAVMFDDLATGTPYLALLKTDWLGDYHSVVIDAMQPQFGVDLVSVHGKLFIACKSAVDRLHVFDGTNVRRTGLTAPDPPTSVVDTGSGAFLGARQYRLRMADGLTSGLLRSEPSTAVTFVPIGTGLAARLTLPAYTPPVFFPSWEIEELAPNGSWYRIATVPYGTATYDDTIADPTLVPITGVLSADSGDYGLQYSAQFLTVDEDRLLLGGAWEQPALSARVSWTPLGSATGVANDERLPFDVQGFIDFDTLDGGGLTGIKAWEGKVIVFKRGQVHQMVRSASRIRSYLSDCLSRRHGAIPYSIVEGTDVHGLSCLYFLDPDVGPMQLGVQGLRVLVPEMQRTWRSSVNLTTATQVASVTYHPEKRQVWWHVAVGAATAPSVRWMYSVETDGVVFHSMPMQVAAAAQWNDKPVLANALFLGGLPAVFLGSGDVDGALADFDTLFRAYVTTKAYQVGGLMRRFQIGSAVIEADSNAGTTITVTCIRDFGLETRSIVVDLAPVGSEPFVTKPIDNCYLSEALSMQFEIGDPPIGMARPGEAGGDPALTPHALAAAWQIHSAVFSYTLGSPSTGRG